MWYIILKVWCKYCGPWKWIYLIHWNVKKGHCPQPRIIPFFLRLLAVHLHWRQLQKIHGLGCGLFRSWGSTIFRTHAFRRVESPGSSPRTGPGHKFNAFSTRTHTQVRRVREMQSSVKWTPQISIFVLFSVNLPMAKVFFFHFKKKIACRKMRKCRAANAEIYEKLILKIVNWVFMALHTHRWEYICMHVKWNF